MIEESEEEKPESEEEQADLAEPVEETEAEEVEEVSEEAGTEEEKEEEAVEAEEEPAPVEEEAKPLPREERGKEEEEIVEEKIYTIPLGKAWIMPANKRAPRAMRMIRSFVVKHMKLEARTEQEEDEEEEEPKRLVVSNEVSRRVWSRGIEKPPRKIRVRAAKDKDGNVTVYLAEGD
jgi:large subunit ribosomal protein L31e